MAPAPVALATATAPMSIVPVPFVSVFEALPPPDAVASCVTAVLFEAAALARCVPVACAAASKFSVPVLLMLLDAFPPPVVFGILRDRAGRFSICDRRSALGVRNGLDIQRATIRHIIDGVSARSAVAFWEIPE